MGELHLDVLVDRMRREFNVEANVGRPQVAYRETIKAAGDCEGKYIKQSGGRGQYGHVWVKFEPNLIRDMNLLIKSLVVLFLVNIFLLLTKDYKKQCKQVFLLDIL